MRKRALVFLLTALVAAGVTAIAAQTPTFRTGIDLATFGVTVVDKKGEYLADGCGAWGKPYMRGYVGGGTGVFTPIQVMPWYLEIPSRIAPLRYAVDFVRGVFYAGTTDYQHVVLQDPAANFAIIGPAFVVCLVIGTFFFVRSERNR